MSMLSKKQKMIKTLRITTIIVVILVAAALFVVVPAVLGLGSDKQIEDFLNAPDAIQKFKTDRGNKTRNAQNQISPLLKQARDFALYLNPPAQPTSAKTTPRKRTTTPRRPSTVASKFKLVGTSFYAKNPALSLALIDEPGKGMHWVRQSSKVGHLVIDKVNDGSVVVRDGSRTFEQNVTERPKRTNLLKSSSKEPTGSKPALPHSIDADIDITAGKTLHKEPLEKDVTIVRPEKGKADFFDEKSLPTISDEEIEMYDSLIEKLKLIQEGDDAAQPAGEMIEEFISGLEATRVSPTEAQKLDRLGKRLQDNQQDPNRAESQKIEKPRRSRRPRRSRKTNKE